jgi:hypothetical protein
MREASGLALLPAAAGAHVSTIALPAILANRLIQASLASRATI